MRVIAVRLVREIGKLAVRQKIASATTQTDAAQLLAKVKARESQRAMIVEQGVQLSLTVSEVKEQEGRMGVSEASLENTRHS